jgi:hypothetical protein
MLFLKQDFIFQKRKSGSLGKPFHSQIQQHYSKIKVQRLPFKDKTEENYTMKVMTKDTRVLKLIV